MAIPVSILFTLDQNRLLASLPADDRERIAQHLEQTVLHAGDILCDAGAVPSHIYFPTSAVLSRLPMPRR